VDLNSIAIRWARKEILFGVKFKEPIVESIKYVTVHSASDVAFLLSSFILNRN
jgi:hypothetical protein